MIDTRKELLADILNRSTSAAIGFSIMALVSMYTALFSPFYQTEIRWLCAGIVLLNGFRLWIKVQCLRNDVGLERYWPFFLTVTGLNGLLWGTCFAIAIYHGTSTNWTILLCLIIYSAFSNASIITLGNNFRLHAGFMVGISLPLFIGVTLRYSRTHEEFFLALAFISILTGAYTLLQGSKFRKRSIEKLDADLALVKSQNELMEQRAMTEHVNRLSSIGEMAAGFAHEINNPLAIVIGNLEILQAELTDKKMMDPQVDRIINKTIGSAVRISKIIRSLRTLSRGSAREGKTHNSLDAIFEETVVLFEQRLAADQIKLIKEFNRSFSLFCDPIQVGQVLVNLLNNACDVIENDKHTTDRWIKISTVEQNGMIDIKVTNSGDPVTEEVRKKIFTPFYTTKPVGQGMGLGLAISRSIAIQHEGSLNVNVENGHTCFHFTLPLRA